MLSRVDGRSSEDEIILATGLAAERVRAALDRLARLGAIRFPVAAQRTPNPIPNPRGVSQPVIVVPPVLRLRSPTIDEAALNEPVELDPERKRVILELSAELDELTHYELLGVASNADRKTIKDAYYGAVAAFHPDRYFGKNLGSYKARLEQIFRRLTEAHDVLTGGHTRQEYDEYLVTRSRNRAFEQALSALPLGGDGNAGPLPGVFVRAGSVSGIWEATDMAASEGQVPTDAPGSRASPPADPSSPRPSDPAMRRRALARKLTGSSLPPTRVSAPPATPAAIREKVAEDLRRHHEQRVAQAQQSQVRRYVQAAEAALTNNQPIAAATALRIAASLAPSNPELAERLRQVETRAASEQADSYLAQAQYEERHGKFAEAARAYERVSRGKPSTRISERIAHCLVESKGDSHKALENARRAVTEAPDSARFRLTLGRAYLLAGMRQSALAELERALALAPDDGAIQDLLRRVKRREI